MPKLLSQDAAAEHVIQAALNSVASEHSKRAYERHLREFFTWQHKTGERELSKAVVEEYAKRLQRRRLSAASINQRLSAIRKLAQQAARTGSLEQHLANGIKAVPGLKYESERSGHPLTKQAAQKLLDAAERAATLKGRLLVPLAKGSRDRAILALMIGCGLRRSEIVDLTYEQIKRRSGRAVLNLGGGPKRRTIPVPSWVKEALDDYRYAVSSARGTMSLPAKGIVFHPVNKGNNVTREKMTERAVYNIVGEHAVAAGLGSVTPYDLRLTFAKLSAPKGESDLDQIHSLKPESRRN